MHALLLRILLATGNPIPAAPATSPVESQSPPKVGAKTYRVSGRVVAVSHICGGGAAITQEMEDRLPPPQPLVGKLLYVVAGEEISSKTVARITAGADGKFELRLPAGTWCVFDAGRTPDEGARESAAEGPAIHVSSDPNVDAECLNQERRRCDEIIHVDGKNQREVQVQFYGSCPEVYNQPCYRGPMPP